MGWKRPLTAALFVAFALIWSVEAPSIAAGALLQPSRRTIHEAPPEGCFSADFTLEPVVLRGWRCAAAPPARGTIVLLHGVGDNRASWRGVIPLLLHQRQDVIAYDSRGHGDSDGQFCTYGYFEKHDLRRIIDMIYSAAPIVLIGSSLGGAVALQEAADDRRITAVVAAETFSDLRTIATERAPFFLTGGIVRRAFAAAEQRAGFGVDDVSPVRDARRITVPVLLVHGVDDVDTPSRHSRRVFDALPGTKRLILVPGAGHNHALSAAATWKTVLDWIDAALTAAAESP